MESAISVLGWQLCQGGRAGAAKLAGLAGLGRPADIWASCRPNALRQSETPLEPENCRFPIAVSLSDGAPRLSRNRGR